MSRTKHLKKAARPPRRTIRGEANEARAELKSLLGAHCYVCRVKPRRGWVAHHLAYSESGTHYARSPSYHIDGRRMSSDRYVLELVKEAREHPDRFVALCTRHHYAVERMLATEPGKFERMLEVMMRSLAARKYEVGHRMRVPPYISQEEATR